MVLFRTTYFRTIDEPTKKPTSWQRKCFMSLIKRHSFQNSQVILFMEEEYIVGDYELHPLCGHLGCMESVVQPASFHFELLNKEDS